MPTPRHRRGRRRSLAALAASAVVAAASLVALLAGSAQPVGAIAALSPPRVPAQGLLFGATVHAQDGQSTNETMAALEARVGRTFAISRVYNDWDEPQPSTSLVDDLAHGRVPLLSIAPQRLNGQKLSWAAIADGTYDADIRAQADALKATGAPILLAFDHEANLATGYGTPADYRAAFRHYVTVFRGEGAANIAFVLILTPLGYDDANDWYPGSSYVDWLGTDAYNFGSCTASVPPWHSLQDEAQPFYSWASRTGKPLVLAEWGAPFDASDPNRRAEWISAAQATIAAWPKIKAAIYFDIDGTCDWQLGSSGASLNAFTAFAHSGLANGRPTASLTPYQSTGTAPLSVRFDLAASTGGGQSRTGTGIASWRLSFGDGSVSTGQGEPQSVVHSYAGGNWTASLTVTDTGGRIASTTASITVSG